MSYDEAIEYFFRVMENGSIRNDEQQEAYELAIRALSTLKGIDDANKLIEHGF